jgi:hypothetical protein
MSFRSLSLVAIGVLALPTWAHHSHGNYSPDFIDLEGVVAEVTLINPHSWVFVEVTDENGETSEWALEATNRGGLERLGVDYDYIGPGDSIKVRCHPLRDGGQGCLMGFLQGRDGTIKDWDGHASRPADDGFFYCGIEGNCIQ